MSSKVITTSYVQGGPVKFNPADDVSLQVYPDFLCRDKFYPLASTSVDGATVSFVFIGENICVGYYHIRELIRRRTFKVLE